MIFWKTLYKRRKGVNIFDESCKLINFCMYVVGPMEFNSFTSNIFFSTNFFLVPTKYQVIIP